MKKNRINATHFIALLLTLCLHTGCGNQKEESKNNGDTKTRVSTNKDRGSQRTTHTIYHPFYFGIPIEGSSSITTRTFDPNQTDETSIYFSLEEKLAGELTVDFPLKVTLNDCTEEKSRSYELNVSWGHHRFASVVNGEFVTLKTFDPDSPPFMLETSTDKNYALVIAFPGAKRDFGDCLSVKVSFAAHWQGK